MEEKKKKKFIIPLPYTGGNLGKTLMFGLVIVLAVVGAMMLQAKELTQIQEDGYVVEEELSDALKNGVTDPVSQDEVELYAVSAWQKVYSRMGSLYVGEEQQKFQKTYPEFLESGSGVRFLDDEATLIGEDMTTRLPVYDGLRVNNGNTFGEDGIQADVENFILTALANGLYINTQNMELTYAENRKVVPVDSVVYFGDSEVRCYSRTEGILKYQEITGLMAAEITIGNLHMNYRDFLDLLRNPGSGSGVDEPSDEPAIYDDGAEEATASAGTIITTPGKAESLDSLKTESNTEEKEKDQNQQDSVKKDSQNSDNNGNASSQNGGNAGGRTMQEMLPQEADPVLPEKMPETAVLLTAITAATAIMEQKMIRRATASKITMRSLETESRDRMTPIPRRIRLISAIMFRPLLPEILVRKFIISEPV